jgi:hypothetical protein
MPILKKTVLNVDSASHNECRGTKRKAAQDINRLHRIKRRKVSKTKDADCQSGSTKRKAGGDFDEPCTTKRIKLSYNQNTERACPTSSCEPKQTPVIEPPSLQTIPPEIRNMIYTHTLVSDQPISISDQQPPRIEPALLLANKAIRAEAIGIFYHSNAFTSSTTSAVGAFFNSLGRGHGKQQKQDQVRTQHPLPTTPNRLAFLRDVSVPVPNKMSKQKPPREIPRSLRENRRCLAAFERDFGRKGLKQGIFSIAMMVQDEVVLATSKNVGQYETIVTKGSRVGVGVIVPKTA